MSQLVNVGLVEAKREWWSRAAESAGRTFTDFFAEALDAAPSKVLDEVAPPREDVADFLDLRTLSRTLREQLLRELGRGDEQHTQVNLRLAPADYARWREVAEVAGAESFAAYAEAALDRAAECAGLARPEGLSYLPSGERRALIRRLTAWGRYCLLFPPGKARAWRRAAKERKLRMQQLVEDAFDEAVEHPPPIVEYGGPRTHALGFSLPETKLALWKKTAGEAGRTFTEWCEAAIDCFTLG